MAIHQLAAVRGFRAAPIRAIPNLPGTLLGITLGGGAGVVAAAPVRTVPPYVQVEPLAESTWVLRAGTANMVAALTPEGWVLVDTGTPMPR